MHKFSLFSLSYMSFFSLSSSLSFSLMYFNRISIPTLASALSGPADDEGSDTEEEALHQQSQESAKQQKENPRSNNRKKRDIPVHHFSFSDVRQYR